MPLAEIWDALRAACETDDATANAILESAGVIVQSSDMSLVWDERGEQPGTAQPCHIIC